MSEQGEVQSHGNTGALGDEGRPGMKSIMFYTEGLPFDGNTIKEKSLGGSETAVYNMALHLAKMGYQVTVQCNLDDPSVKAGNYDGVEYADNRQFLEVCKAWTDETRPDVLVVSRHAYILAAPEVDARANVLWCHDIVSDEWASIINGVMYKVDLVMFNTRWALDQARTKLTQQYPEEMFYITRNGIDLPLIYQSAHGKVKRDPNKVIYTSRPDRGLDVLLAAWPKLRERYPKLELFVAYYAFPQVDTNPAELQGFVNKLMKQMDDLADQGVHKLESLPKPELYKQLASSRLVIYPSVFPETSCISAMEAMACGTPMVAADYCALKETLPPEVGVRVPGTPREVVDGEISYDMPFQGKFIEAISRLLDSRAEWMKLSHAGISRAMWYNYATIAREWQERFSALLATVNHKQTVCATLLARDDELDIRRALTSIKDHVDEIRVWVDTRTKDGTEKIAREFTDKVFPLDWEENGFDWARNASLRGIESDWVLWIDCDEVLETKQGIKKYLRRNGFNAYAIAQVHVLPNADDLVDYPCRLFRNGIGVKFYGRIHEQPELIEPNKGIPVSFVAPDLRIQHHGYGWEGAVDERWERNHAYIQKDFEDNQARDTSWFMWMRENLSHAIRQLRTKTNGNFTPEIKEMLLEVQRVWDLKFSDPKHIWHVEAWKVLQSALTIINYPELAFVLTGTMQGALPQGVPMVPQKVRVRNREEAMTYMTGRVKDLVDKMFPPTMFPHDKLPEEEDGKRTDHNG